MYTLFLKNKAQINKNNIMDQCFSGQNKSVCQNQLDPAKNENQHKKRYAPLLQILQL